MEIINRVSRMASITAKTLVTDVKIGLVQTAGAINPGHLSLIRAAREMADLAVVSILVNPLEFSSREEYEKFPRDITTDIDLLRQESVDYVFIPPEDEMFPPRFSTSVEVQNLGNEMAGLPSVFLKGMTTGALKMLHITKPAYTFYGQQDALQATILRKLVRDLNISTEVIIAPSAREASGLAYSGRNRFLTEFQMSAAPVFHRSLGAAEASIAAGETNAKKVLAEMSRIVGAEPLAQLEYAVIMDPDLLESVSRIQGSLVVAVGGRIGNVFLSDAIVIEKPAKALI